MRSRVPFGSCASSIFPLAALAGSVLGQRMNGAGSAVGSHARLDNDLNAHLIVHNGFAGDLEAADGAYGQRHWAHDDLMKRQSASTAENAFFWSYTGTASNTTLRQCATISVTYETGDGTTSQLVPPMYLVAIPLGGYPTQISLGSGTTGSFVLPFATGTQFTMGVVDSQGHQGGFVGLLNVIGGASSSCVSVSSSPVTLGLNTTNVGVCSYLGAQVSGGSSPYTFTVVPAGSIASTTNITLAAPNDYFGYLAANNAGTQLLVAARDAQGNWAPTSPVVHVTGSDADLPSCGGLSDFQGSGAPTSGATVTSATSTTPSATATGSSGFTSSTTGSSAAGSGGSSNTSSGGSSNAGAIAGGVVGGIVGGALLLLLAFCLYRRKRRRSNDTDPFGAPTSRPVIEDHGDMAEAGPLTYAPVTPFDLSEANSSGRTSFTPPGAVRTPAGSSHRPDSSIAGTQGHDLPMLEGGFRLANPDNDDGAQLAPPLSRYAAASSGSSDIEKGAMTSSSSSDMAPVRQHRDGGRFIEEAGHLLPSEVAPPYTDLHRDPSTSRRRL